MLKQFIALSICIFSTLFAGSHWNEEQVVDYVHYSELQRRSSWHLLSQIKFHGDENVLDVGCGDGRNTAWMAWLVRQGSVIGIDPSVAMISWAKKQYHPFEFPNLSFLEADANHLPNGLFDVITAFFSLHIVKEKQLAIQGFFNQLNRGGKVIAAIPHGTKYNPEYTAAVRETMDSSKWNKYFTDFKPTFLFEDLENYISYFQNAGFSILLAHHVPSVDPFVNRQEFIHWILGTWPQIHYLPVDKREEFVSDIIDNYLSKRPLACSEDGVLYFYWGHYEIIAQKDN